MEIQEIPTEKIHPDPNQPRTVVEEKQVKEMALSLLTEGVINPIEIDSAFMIVTGEMRWRASKMAGLKTIPCKVIDIDNDMRFRRQVIENIHHNTMSIMDTSKAIAKLINFVPGAKSQGQDMGISKISRKIGKSEVWVREILAYLTEPKDVQEYLESTDAHHSFIREINRGAPEELKDELKKKVMKGDIKDRETINEVIRAVKRTPEKAKEILDTDFSGKMPENMHKIHRISPPTVIPQEGRLAKDVVHDQLNAISNMYEKMLDIMEAVDWDNAPMQTIKMLYTNGNMFRQGFEAFQGKLVAIIEGRKPVEKKQLEEES